MANLNESKNRKTGLIYSPSLGYIYPDVLKGDRLSLQSAVPQVALEDSTVLTTTVIQQPKAVSVYFEMTNTSTSTYNTPQQVFEKLVSIWEKGELVTVITSTDVYENLQILNAPFQHAAPYKNALAITCDFIMMNFKKPETFEFEYATDTNGANKTAQTITEAGQKTPQSTKQTALYYFGYGREENTVTPANLEKINLQIEADQARAAVKDIYEAVTGRPLDERNG